MYDGRSKLSEQVADEIKKNFGTKMFKNVIPRNVRLAEAPSFGQPIMLYDSKCAGAKAYEAVTEEFIKMQKYNKIG
jgi:chromosome partitioning protein